MSIRALSFAADQQRTPPRPAELAVESQHAFLKTLPQTRPMALVVRNQDLDRLRQFRSIVIDRGKKHVVKELAAKVLGQKKTPLIAGSYTSDAQLLHSVRSLLLRAVREGDRNVYVIGADDEVFDKLWDKTAKAARKQRTRRAGRTAAECVSTEQLGNLLPPLPVPPELEEAFIGTSRVSQLIRQFILRAAYTIDDVLILGDTGTGKEVVARCICKQSGREPLITFNCAGYAGDHLEAALFGEVDAAHPKKSSLGFWQLAGEGTLVLDEIGGLQPQHQVKVLRALEQRRVRPVGGEDDVSVPARVVATSNRDLFALMQAGQFREDLYYRLRSFTIRIPPLRTHREDIPSLAQVFWKDITWDKGSSLPPDILYALQSAQYRWPGNARELKAVLSALHALFGKDDLRVQHLHAVLQDQGQTSILERVPGTGGEIGQQRVDCLRHLRHVDEVLRACQVTLRPVIEKRRIDMTTIDAVDSALHYRLHELELLCMNPLLFHSAATFSAINRLKGGLSYFHSLLKTEPKEALQYWKKEVGSEFKLALRAVFKEVERVMA